jgi:metal-dependent amidase/aminoacylase/carboxypeptidase family protein
MGTIRTLFIIFALVAPSLSAQTGRSPWTTPTRAEVDAIYPDIEALYIDLHRNPELGFQETQTASKLVARVRALGFDVTTVPTLPLIEVVPNTRVTAARASAERAVSAAGVPGDLGPRAPDASGASRADPGPDAVPG